MLATRAVSVLTGYFTLALVSSPAVVAMAFASAVCDCSFELTVPSITLVRTWCACLAGVSFPASFTAALALIIHLTSLGIAVRGAAVLALVPVSRARLLRFLAAVLSCPASRTLARTFRV